MGASSVLAVQNFGDQTVVEHTAAVSSSPYTANITQIITTTSELAMAGMTKASSAPFWNAEMSSMQQQQHHHVDPYHQFLKPNQSSNHFCIGDNLRGGWDTGNQANSDHESLLIRSSSLPQSSRLMQQKDRCNIENNCKRLYRAESCSISTICSDQSLHNFPSNNDPKMVIHKANGVESSDEDQQTSMQQTKITNGNFTLHHKGNINSRKRARIDHNSNIKAIETPPDVVHVRARRGQATDSHSLAERVRREKISQRMKVLQEIVPGCHKVLGKAMMLDEIINYVKSLQKQVEFLSMKLAAANQVGLDSMVVNKDYSFSNEFLQNISGFPSHGDVVFLNFPNELSSTCQQLRSEGQIPSSI